MTSQDQSYLRFSLEETVRFTNGQEVGELYSISLDPQIQTEEEDQFIRMHGFLELSGEYAPSEQRGADKEYAYNYKYVQQVLERGDNECEFFHHFPIDITIPKSRISKMEDVEIYIDSFDYEFPERANLKLIVDLSISGVIEEEPETGRVPAAEPVEKEPEAAAEKPAEEEPEFSMLKLDVNTAEDLQAEGEKADFSIEVKRQPDEPKEEEKLQPVQAAEERKEKKQIESPDLKLTAESPAAFELPPMETNDMNESPSMELEHVNESPSMEPENVSESPSMKFENVNESPSVELENINESPSTEPAEEEPQKKPKTFSLKKTETMSLADFFARKDAEEAVTWKVCLVQREDTLQKIAERYKLPVAELVRENKLETNQSIEEGQVLYIPNTP